ncbi:cupin domain-containing protein [Pedobacter sp. ASV1-7]|uniref:cupin domain-containing protein n=1 Tax=Pedobacter sp. ASV1-7 TaxID=3145237 RepID=UPI0032E8C793
MKFNLVNTTKALFFIALSFVFISFNNKTISSLNFDKEKKQISKQNIIGEGTQQILVDQKALNKAHVSEITLAPNSYTHWHSHPGGQIMLVTDGEGVYQSKGKSKVKIKKGDVIETMGGLYHWSGSAPNSSLSYISIKIVKENGLVNWHEPMTKGRYLE